MPITHIYLLQHSHTDIGFANDQPIIWELQERFIDEALRLARRDRELSDTFAFRWTVESSAVVMRWLRHASLPQIDEFSSLVHEGRIEITAMFANMAPTLDTGQMIESLVPLSRLRSEYSLPVRQAMICDVNGMNWPLVEILLDAGIEGLTMAVNNHMGGTIPPRPGSFYWEGISGRRVKVYNGWNYAKGWREGIGWDDDDFSRYRWPRMQRYLEDIGYPYPFLMLQTIHPFGDDGSAYDYGNFLHRWEKEERNPQIIMATPTMWWDAMEQFLPSFPVYRGDWSDFWNFGCISTAREQALDRRNRVCLRVADGIYAALKGLSDKQCLANRSFQRYRSKAWFLNLLWGEHTWGADMGIRQPQAEDALTMWYHKAALVYKVRSLGNMLRRDAIAEFSRHVKRSSSEDFLIWNPLPWKTKISGHIPYFCFFPRGVPDDPTASRHHQDRHHLSRRDPLKTKGVHLHFPPVEVPGFGYSLVKRGELIDFSTEEKEILRDDCIETPRFRLRFDMEQGGLHSWYDKMLDCEWMDTAQWRGHQYVHESVPDRTHPWPRAYLYEHQWHVESAEIPPGWKTDRRLKYATTKELLSHKIFHSPLGHRVQQVFSLPNLTGTSGTLVQETWIPSYADWIEFRSRWSIGLDDHPQGHYLLFPFDIPHARCSIDVGGQVMQAEDDQLPGACRDYFTAQGWVDFSNEERGMTISVSEHPMVQAGEFSFARYKKKFSLSSALFLGWVANNYWETNFQAVQPGELTTRYRMLPHKGKLVEADAHRFSMESAHHPPLVQHMGETPEKLVLPPSGSLLTLPEPPVLVVHLLHHQGMVDILLQNADDQEQEVQVNSGLLRVRRNRTCSITAEQHDAWKEGEFITRLKARQLQRIQLEVVLK